jgi:hypothetical protein
MMAKISAHGAHEVGRHQLANGTQYLLRSDGKIMHKFPTSDHWSIVRSTRLPTDRLWALIKSQP